jgi:alpha-beta hydrolase superfamily lysophospholipase
MTPRRVLLIALGLVVIAWALVPAARAFVLLRNTSAPRYRVEAVDARPLDEVTFRARDGVRLSGSFNVNPAGRGTVILVHGFKSSRVEMVDWFVFLDRAGYSVLLYDSRGCGASDGTFGVGATEDRDISGAVDFVQTRKAAGWERIAVLGISLGAGDAILAAARDDRIRAVVADSPWIDEFVQLERMRSLPVGPLAVPLLPYEPALVDALIGGRLEDVRLVTVVDKIAPRSLLLIHALDDANATTPVGASDRLFHVAGEPKGLWLVPSGGHVGAIRAHRDEYERRVLAFLQNALAQ